MAQYLSGTYNSTYTLTTNPTTVTSTGLIDVNTTIAGASGIVGTSGVVWTLTNLGTVESVGSRGVGVDLQSGGFLTNGQSISAAGLIIGAAYGVRVTLSGTASGTVTNFGTIMGTAGYVYGTGTLSSYVGASGISIESGGGVFGTETGTGVVLNDGTITAAGSNAHGVAILGGYLSGVTVTNLGTVIATGTGSEGIVTFSRATNVITNGQSGGTDALVSGGRYGIFADGVYHTIMNFGTIQATQSNGVGLFANIDDTITNGQSGATAALIAGPKFGVYLYESMKIITNFGTISGGTGIYALRYYRDYTHHPLYDPTTLINAGTVIGTAGDGVYLGSGGGLITNAAGALIEGVRAAVLLAPDGTTTYNLTIANSGTLTGDIGIDISTTGAVGNTGNNTIVNFGTIIGTGGTAISLGTVGSDLVVIGSTNSSLQGVVANVLPGDRLDLPFLTFSSGGTATLVSNGTVSQQLKIAENAGTFTIALDPNQNFSGDTFQLSTDAGTGTLVTERAVCFCRGTLILTERGEVAVEDLRIGDPVMTLAGAAKAIRWIGMGRDLVTHRHSLARPIVVRAGALADNVPRRDLYLTHGHALYIDGVLVPVEHLVNHRSILWDEAARIVEYYHIELADHDVLLAEGAPAESYYDAGNRALFHNTRPGSSSAAVSGPCAPVLTAGAVVERTWARLYERAGGQVVHQTTDDPDLHLVVDGKRLDPVATASFVYSFAVERPPAATLLLGSRSGVLSLVGIDRSDHRRLGVPITQIVLWHAGIPTCFEHDAPQLREGGCHLAEDGYCWTDGELALPARFFSDLRGGFMLVVHTKRHYMRYPIEAEGGAAAALAA